MKMNLDSRGKKILAGTAAVFAFGAVLAAVSTPPAAVTEVDAISVDADDGIGDGAGPPPVIEEPVIEEPATEPVEPVATPEQEPEVREGTRSDPHKFANNYGWKYQVNSYGDSDDSVWMIVVDQPELPVKREGEVVFFAALQLESANKEPLSTWLDFDFEVVGGATNEVHTGFDNRCDSDLWYDNQESAMNWQDEVFVGGSVAGMVCIKVPAEDISHPDTVISVEVGNDYRVYFGPFGG